MSPVAAALVLAVLATTGRPARCNPGERPTRLPVLVTETPRAVRLRIQLPEDVDPGSVEVQLAGREVAVVARSASGEQLRSETQRLSEPALEDGAQADWEPDGTMTITLPRASPEK